MGPRVSRGQHASTSPASGGRRQSARRVDERQRQGRAKARRRKGGKAGFVQGSTERTHIMYESVCHVSRSAFASSLSVIAALCVWPRCAGWGVCVLRGPPRLTPPSLPPSPKAEGGLWCGCGLVAWCPWMHCLVLCVPETLGPLWGVGVLWAPEPAWPRGAPCPLARHGGEVHPHVLLRQQA